MEWKQGLPEVKGWYWRKAKERGSETDEIDVCRVYSEDCLPLPMLDPTSWFDYVMYQGPIEQPK